MKIVFQIQKPDDMQATIVLTATVGEFRELRTQLSGKWPSAEFSRSIGDVIRQAESTFYADESEQTKRPTGTNCCNASAPSLTNTETGTRARSEERREGKECASTCKYRC